LSFNARYNLFKLTQVYVNQPTNFWLSTVTYNNESYITMQNILQIYQFITSPDQKMNPVI